MRTVSLLTTLALAAAAQQPGTPKLDAGTLVRATGEATVTIKPDTAKIQIGVTTNAPTAAVSSAENAKRTTAVIDEMKKLAGAKAVIETINYSVHPEYRHSPSGAPPTITGYTTNNTVVVTIHELDMVSKLIDAATRTGANTIHGLHFTVKDEQAARALALKPAAVQARANAEAMAQALGMRVVRIVSVEEGERGHIRPLPQMEMAMAAQARVTSTPVQPRDIEMRAVVTITVQTAADGQ